MYYRLVISFLAMWSCLVRSKITIWSAREEKQKSKCKTVYFSIVRSKNCNALRLSILCLRFSFSTSTKLSKRFCILLCMKPLVHYKKRSCQQRTYAQLTPVLNTPHAQRTSTKIDKIKNLDRKFYLYMFFHVGIEV